MFKDSAAPTRANVKKRLLAAEEALASAMALTEKAKDPKLREAIRNGRGWVQAAKNRLEARKGERF